MKYGFFDEVNKEYVITRPDTPAPWANYLGSPAYGAIVSNNAGGYSFVKSGANGRILRYHFNSDDTPGRYIYLRDDETSDFWSASLVDTNSNIINFVMGPASADGADIVFQIVMASLQPAE